MQSQNQFIILQALAYTHLTNERYAEGQKEEEEGGESKRKKDSQTTDPTLSLLRQLWCAVDAFVVVSFRM